MSSISYLKRWAVLGLSFALAAGSVSAAQSIPNIRMANSYPANCSGNGTPVTGATMTYSNGVDSGTADTTVGKPGFMACRDSGKNYYMVMIGLNNGSSIDEDLGAYKDYTFSITVPTTAGDVIGFADGLGSISNYVINTSSVSFNVTPARVNVVNGSDRPAGCDPPSENGRYKASCSGTNASATEFAARVSVRYSAFASPSFLPGMTVSANADLFYVQVDAGCPTARGGSADVATALDIQLLGPHFEADGTTVNTGSLTAFLPTSTILSCFGSTMDPTTIAESVQLERTEDGALQVAQAVATTAAATTGLAYVVTPSVGGLTVTVPTITFSQPTYKMKFGAGKAAASVKKGKKRTKSQILSDNSITLAKGQKMSVKIAKASKKVCAVSGTSIKAKKAGTCSYTVIVKKGKKTISTKSGTLTVT